MVSMNHNKKPNEFQAGDIVNVQGTGVISKMIRWATNYDYSHTAMICCRLSNGQYMVIEMVAKGILIRPLSVYKGKKAEVFRIKHKYGRAFGQAAVLAGLAGMERAGYNFPEILYAGLILIPRRLLHPKSFSSEVSREPETAYQVLCYWVAQIISVVTFMRYWTSIFRLFSKDKWLKFTERISKQITILKTAKGDISFEEFVQIVEAELKTMDQ